MPLIIKYLLRLVITLDYVLLEPGGSDPSESMAVETIGAIILGSTMVQRYIMEGKCLFCLSCNNSDWNVK